MELPPPPPQESRKYDDASVRANSRTPARTRGRPQGSANNAIGKAKNIAGKKRGGYGDRKLAVAAVVLRVTVTVPPCNPSRLMVLGEAVQVDCDGAPAQLTLTFPVKPPRGKTGRLKLPELPAFNVRDLVLGVKV